MIRKLFIGTVLASLLLPGTAEAQSQIDYLNIAYQRMLYPSRVVLMYDQCVAAGYIDGDNSGISAEVKFQSYIDTQSAKKDPLRGKDVQDEDVAASMHKAFNDVKNEMIKFPKKIGQPNCYFVSKSWPGFSKQYGLQ